MNTKIIYSFTFFVCLPLLIVHCQNKESTESTEGCKTLKTNTKEYVEFFPIKKQINSADFLLIFRVKCDHDASILLSRTANPSLNDSAYEIVLGAGNNTHSTIRRKQNTDDKRFIKLRDLVSNNEWRRFWIKYTKNGLLQVGNEGELPFLFWKDSEPINVEYFSFTVKSNTITGSWAYDCPTHGAPTENYGQCKIVETRDTNYTEFFPIEKPNDSEEITLNIGVKFERQGTILLSPTINPSFNQPVCEIVFESGKNTYPTIRRKVNLTNNGGINQPVLISEKKWSKFWIKYNRNGLLRVGNEGEQQPYLSWRDSEPIDIKYFSFSSSSDSTVVLWAYDCPSFKVSPKENFEKCKLLKTYDTNYREFFPIQKPNNSGDIFLTFHVMCERDASVLLSNSNTDPWFDDQAYELNLAINGTNCSTVQRSCANSKSIFCGENIIKNKRWRKFWIKYSAKGLLQVGKEDEELPILSLRDERPIDIKYVSFASQEGVLGLWTYNC